MTTTNNFVSRDSILGSPCKRRFKTVEVAGQKWRIRSVTAKEYAEHQASQFNSQGRFNRESVITGQARWLVIGCVDGDGNPLFTNKDVAAIQDLDAGIVGAVALAIIEFSDVDDDAAKNSNETDGDDSPIG